MSKGFDHLKYQFAAMGFFLVVVPVVAAYTNHPMVALYSFFWGG
jgi:hypothetical protein